VVKGEKLSNNGGKINPNGGVPGLPRSWEGGEGLKGSQGNTTAGVAAIQIKKKAKNVRNTLV